MKKEIFISHCWNNDLLNRNNHHRCIEFANKLKNIGYNVWIDNDEMIGNIDNAIIKGINNCHVVLLCLTEKYINKINNAIVNQNLNDNCYKEWNYSLFKKKIIIPIIMEEKAQHILLNESGIIQMYLNNILFINMSDFNMTNFDYELKLLCKTLAYYNIYTKKEKIFYKSSKNIKLSFNNLLYKTLTNLSPRKKNTNKPNILSTKLIINQKKIRRIYL